MIRKGDIFDILYGNVCHECEVYTNSDAINELSIGEDIIYSDGDGIWKVKDKHNRSITVEALNDSLLINGKTLNYGKLVYCEDSDLFKDAVQGAGKRYEILQVTLRSCHLRNFFDCFMEFIQLSFSASGISA